MRNDITKVKNGGYCLQLSEGVQKRGSQKKLKMDSKFPEGYFEWLDKRAKYDHKGGSVLDYMVACDIQRQADAAESQVSMMRAIDKKLGAIKKLLEGLNIEVEEVENGEDIQDGSVESSEGSVSVSGCDGEYFEISEEDGGTNSIES